MHCNNCDIDLPQGNIKCHICKRLVLGQKAITSVTNYDDGAFKLSEVKEEDCVRYDVDYLNRIFGGPILNTSDVENGEPEINGPGFTRDSVILLGGNPGAGKSTLMLQLSDILLKRYKGEVLYVAAEEKAGQIFPRAKRLKIKNIDRIIILPAIGGNVDVGLSIMMRKPLLTIIDSIAGLVGSDNQQAAVQVAQQMKEYSDKLNIPILLTQHLTKGEEIAGLNTLQHGVDTVLFFHPDSDNPDIRVLEVNPKNRFGRAYIENYFVMGEHGLDPVPNGVTLEDLDDNEDE